jgi:hypothetical protein
VTMITEPKNPSPVVPDPIDAGIALARELGLSALEAELSQLDELGVAEREGVAPGFVAQLLADHRLALRMAEGMEHSLGLHREVLQLRRAVRVLETILAHLTPTKAPREAGAAPPEEPLA